MNEDDWTKAFRQSMEPSPTPSDDEQMSEVKERKPKKFRDFEYSAWKDLETQRANITFGQLFQVAPALKGEVKKGITDAKPKVRFEDVEVNVKEKVEEEEEDAGDDEAADCCCKRPNLLIKC